MSQSLIEKLEASLHENADDPTGMYHKGVSDSFAAIRSHTVDLQAGARAILELEPAIYSAGDIQPYKQAAKACAKAWGLNGGEDA